MLVVRTAFLPLALALASSGPWAQANYPSRPVRLVASFPAGAPFDAMSRKYAEALALVLKAPVVVENKPGANGAIAASEVSRATPDGYTLLVTVSDPLISTPAISKVGYDPDRDFLPIAKIGTSAPVLVVNAKCEDQLKELILASKKDPSSACAAYGSYGPGSFPMLVLEAINRQAQASFRDVPYRGVAPAMQDLLGGQIGLTFTGASQATQLAREGKVKPVAILGTARSALLPQTPTFIEAGYDNFATRRVSWLGLVAPAGLAADTVAKLAKATRSVVTDPDFLKWLKSQDFEASGATPVQFDKELKAERAAVTDFIRDELKIVPQ